MRDKSFIAMHRGGLLSKEDHRNLNLWARECSLILMKKCNFDPTAEIIFALEISLKWESMEASVGDARKAAVLCHQKARESSDSMAKNIYRAVAHAVATAHMADHCLGVVYYGNKALQTKGHTFENSLQWQLKIISENFSHLMEQIIKGLEIKKIAR